jgi:hypothetical protein
MTKQVPTGHIARELAVGLAAYGRILESD